MSDHSPLTEQLAGSQIRERVRTARRTATGRATTAGAPGFAASLFSVGNSLMHGAHQVAHRLTSTGAPAKLAMSVVLPSASAKVAVGASAPRWLRSTPFTGPATTAGA